jgi:predicted AlkP superfamily phosphohydrolase/phosphomutase
MTAHKNPITKAARRVFMLQIDSVSLSFIEKNFSDLPNLKSLFDKGQLVKIYSTANSITASAWASFASTLEPGGHGQYFPLQWDPKTLSMHRAVGPFWGDQLDYEPFWYDLGREGYRCIVLDANETIEHEDAPVLEISNWSSQESARAFTSEPKVLKELRSKFGRRPIGKEVPVRKALGLSTRIRDQLINSVRMKCDAIIWLSQQQPWDLFIAGIYDLHRAGHNLWPTDLGHGSTLPVNALLDVYKAFDEKLEEILQSIDSEETAIIVYSLHGMRENNAQNHFLPEIMQRLNKRYLEQELTQTGTSHRPGVMSFLRKRVPARLQYYLAQLLGERIQDWVVAREFLGSLNWSQTTAFALPAGDEGFIRLNLQGREKKGFLPDTDNAKTHYIEWLRERLFEIKVVTTGDALVEKFDLAEDLFPGPRCEMLPDIIVHWKPNYPVSEIVSDAIGVVHMNLNTGRNGNHSAESFAVLTGNIPDDFSEDELRSITDYGSFVRRLLI